MHPTYRALIRSRVLNARNDAEALAGIEHDGLKGHLREIVIRELFRPLMPADLGLGSGEVITVDGKTSSQQDVVIFDRSILPPVLMEAAGIFPIESVLYTVEVKSSLKRVDLRAANDSAGALKRMTYVAGSYDQHDQPVNHPVERARHALLAFDSEVPNVAAAMEEFGGLDPGLVAICVVECGYWYWDARQSRWITWGTVDPLMETVAFLSGVMNTIPDIRVTRRRPRIGNYLL